MVMEDQEIGLASECIPVPRVHDSLVVEVNQQQLQIPAEKEEITNKTGQRKPRHRKKALHASILKQMEFYFSDANLSKDRFLSNVIQEDPYVSLSTFLEFNKIKALTTETTRIAKALESSKILSLSEDGTKVRRNTPINFRDNSDEYTVYVQGLPPDADHDWLISIFSQYGSVAYVSIPRYKRNKKLKGFAFVEFDNVEGAEKCLKAFQDKHCILPFRTTPEEIQSISTFTQDDDTPSLFMNNIPDKTLNINKIEPIKADPDASECKKRSLSPPTDASSTTAENDEDFDGMKSKKIKIEEPTNPEIKKDHDSKVENKKLKINSTNEDDKKNEVTSDEKINEETKDGDEKKKKKRKRKSRGHKNDHYQQLLLQQQQEQQQQQQSDLIDFGLRIMAKKEWKKLRNKYLQSQRDKMKQLKQHLLKKSNRWNPKHSPVLEKMDVNPVNEEQDKSSKKQDSAPKFSFAEGLIIKMELDEPCANPKNLKNQLKSAASSDATLADIQYVDVREGDHYVYIRCDSAANAEKLLKNYFEDKTSVILSGEEEKEYWDKIFRDREQKFMISKKNRTKQRGRDKLLKKAEKELGKHIRFDD